MGFDFTKQEKERFSIILNRYEKKLYSSLINYYCSLGHLQVVVWLRENGYPYNGWTTAWAAGGGHLELLKWLRVIGCPWN